MRRFWTRTLVFAATVAGALLIANCKEREVPTTDRPQGPPTTSPVTGEQGPLGPAADGGMLQPTDAGEARADAGTTPFDPEAMEADAATGMPDAGGQLDR